MEIYSPLTAVTSSIAFHQRDADVESGCQTPSTEQEISRANRLLTTKLTFVHSAEFEQEEAETRILHAPLALPRSPDERLKRPGAPVSGRSDLCREKPLSRELERDLFRRMNFLKFLGAAARRCLDPESPSVSRMNRIEQLISDAAEIRNRIVSANQRLIASIARRFQPASPEFDELISDANLTLMKAVGRFDYNRGLRFSTYVTHAVRRDFYRRYKRNSRRQRRETAICPEDLIQMFQTPAADDGHARQTLQMRCVKDLIGQYLSARDRSILDLRYGLSSDDGGRTLEQVGAELGLSKERVRQLQLRSIERIRALMQHGSSAFEPPERF
ncbi:MAG: sigma-70 family RNA polymerase sigma factor [Fuerstiella sp.]